MFRIYVEVMLMLCDETIEIYLSVPQCARGRPLSDPLKWDHRISITFVSITSFDLDLRQAIT